MHQCLQKYSDDQNRKSLCKFLRRLRSERKFAVANFMYIFWNQDFLNKKSSDFNVNSNSFVADDIDRELYLSLTVLHFLPGPQLVADMGGFGAVPAPRFGNSSMLLAMEADIWHQGASRTTKPLECWFPPLGRNGSLLSSLGGFVIERYSSLSSRSCNCQNNMLSSSRECKDNWQLDFQRLIYKFSKVNEHRFCIPRSKMLRKFQLFFRSYRREKSY